jgi:hypothetical protein
MSETTAQKQGLDLAAAILQEASAKVAEALDQPEHGMIRLAVTTDITKVINRLLHLGGIAVQVPRVGPDEFPPITNFMGEDITQKNPLLGPLADTRIPDDVQLLLARIEKYYPIFDTIAPEGIINDFGSRIDDILLIRGIAKRAGVPDFEDARITIAFIEKIQKAIIKKRKDEKAQERIEQNLKAQEEIVDTKKRITEVEEKQKQLDSDLLDAGVELQAAEKPAAKKKVEAKIEEISSEITAAEQLRQTLLTNLAQLEALQQQPA